MANFSFFKVDRLLPCNSMLKNDLISYIKNQTWFFRVRGDSPLLFISSRQIGFRAYVREWFGMDFADTIFLPLQKKPARVFNADQTDAFHAQSKKYIFDRPEILSDWIEKDLQTWKEIGHSIRELRKHVDEEDVIASIRDFEALMSLHQQSSASFIITLSLGLQLTKYQHELHDIEEIIRKHDAWRNKASLEEDMENVIRAFLLFFFAKRSISCDAIRAINNLSVTEVLAWVRDPHAIDVIALITHREKYGYIFIDAQGYDLVLIDDSEEMRDLSDFLLRLYEKEQEEASSDKKIIGRTAFGTGVLYGQVVIVCDRVELDEKKELFDGKILVAIQTTPNFIPYMKDVLAIVTDEGGITCHAAIVAREMKKPCIIGTKVATKMLHDGDEIEMNCDTGEISILKHK